MKQLKAINQSTGTLDVLILSVKPDQFRALTQAFGLSKMAKSGLPPVAFGTTKNQFAENFSIGVGLIAKGNVAAAADTMQLLATARPKWVLAVDICGGIKDSHASPSLGDLVVAKTVHYYELQVIRKKTDLEVMPVQAPSVSLLDIVNKICVQNVPWQKNIAKRRPKNVIHSPKVHVGEIAVGDKLLDQPKSSLLKRLCKKFPRSIAVNMEDSGVARAVYTSARQLENPPDFLSIRCVTDHADRKGNQNTRKRIKPYAYAVAAAFTSSLVGFYALSKPTTADVIPPISRMKIDAYLTRLQGVLISQRNPNLKKFNLTIKNQSNLKDVDISYIAHELLNAKKLILRGHAGGGKTTTLLELCWDLLTSPHVTPVFISLGRLQYSSRRSLFSTKTTSKKKFELLLRVALGNADPLFFIDLARAGRSMVFLIDGLNEIPRAGAALEVFAILGEFLDKISKPTSVIITDRLGIRNYPSTWDIYEMQLLDDEEVKKHFARCYSQKKYKNLHEQDKKMLRIPYFLELALKNSEAVGPAAEAIRSFFMSQLKIKKADMDTISTAAFQAYALEKGRLFNGRDFAKAIKPVIFNRLLTAGTIRVSSDGKCFFDHQLNHDFLAAYHVASQPGIWNWRTFDIISFESASFEAISMVLQQLQSKYSGDTFLKAVYDWNWYAAVKSMLDVSTKVGKNYSRSLETSLVCLIAEKLNDPIEQTADRAKRLIQEIEMSLNMPNINFGNSKELIEFANAQNEDLEWFHRWKTLFSLVPDSLNSLGDSILAQIKDTDSILGWTTANVIRRFHITDSQVELLKSWYYDSTRSDLAEARSTRWRIVHALGTTARRDVVDFLCQALESDKYMWARYGAARSLVEIAALGTDSGFCDNVMKQIETRIASINFHNKILQEISNTMRNRKAPHYFLDRCEPLLNIIENTRRTLREKEDWHKIIQDFKKFRAEREQIGS